MVYLQRCHGWCHKKLLPSHFTQSHIRKVYACLAVTCHLRFWQNDRGLLRATAVTRGWNGYRNRSQHRKLTLEKKILPLFQQGFEPATFQSESGALTTELSPPTFDFSISRVDIPDPSKQPRNIWMKDCSSVFC